MADSEPLHRRHTRSVSAGGNMPLAPLSRPSALRKTHQRAASHGQIGTEEGGGFIKGHNRVGSKTDFILPPGHRDGPATAQQHSGKGHPRHGSTAGKGHARQASRTDSIYTLRQNAPPSRLDLLISFILRKKSKNEGPEVRTRTVVPNHIVPPRTYPNPGINKIRTTKYTVFNFLIKNLIEQFHRVANLYFIGIVLLNWVPSINAFGKEVAMIPVLFVLGVTGVKDLFEDRRRNASDKRINNSTCRVYNGEEERYKKITWKEIRVGDIVHLSNNEVVPADVLLLRTSDDHGTCYLDTCNLDGESNLKLRNVPQGFVDKQHGWRPSDFHSILEVDPPTTKLYQFHGAIVDPDGGRIPVSTDQLLLRDSVIKNTDFAEGIVVYAGHETKAMLNNSGPRYKRSTLEKMMNRDVVWCVVMLIFLCTLGSIGSKLWLDPYQRIHDVPFITNISANDNFEAFLNFWTFVIILQTMIPLSLYVAIEMAKLLQLYHINNNLELYDAESNRRTECRALNITEQLGQIQYVFSDKTGTLTENKMVFRRCTIGGIDYNHPSARALKGESLSMQLTPNPKLLEHLAENNTIQSQNAREFLLALSLCNTVVVATHPHVDIMNSSGVIEGDKTPPYQPESLSYRRLLEESRTPTPPPTPPVFLPHLPSLKEPHSAISRPTSLRPRMKPTLSPISSSAESSPTTQPKSSPTRPFPSLLNVPSMFFKKTKNGKSPKTSSDGSKPIFEAESPDELALVQMAYIYNCRLMKRTPTKAIVSLAGESIMEFEILKILPFDSSRKCMSVIVRKPVTNEIVVYTKGADSAIFPRLVNPSAESITEGQIQWYSSQGLRVLAIASRVIPEDDWPEIKLALDTAVSAPSVKQAYAVVESGLSLIGGTGIEDRLQEGVPETLKCLRVAGIVVWVLTGDKIETATNIALSSGLFSPTTDTLRLAARSKHSAEAAIHFYKEELDRINPRVDSSTATRPSKALRPKAVIIDGKTLTFILDPRSGLTQPFLELTKHCVAVLCCRVTPLQKAYIVKVVKERLRMRTLAIGDGANDVSMIQAADVGIGISGQEGMQAVMASDFAIARFKFLKPLLLVHGHWAYHRLANMVLYFFYKNVTFVFLIFWYQLYCGFSGTVMIDQMYHMLYNLFFTSLPPLAIGVYDQHAPEHLLSSRPSLYEYGRLGKAYQAHSFWLVVLDSAYQSLMIFYIAVATYMDTDMGIWEFGSVITSSCMFAMLGQVALETRSWTILHVGALVLSVGAFYAFFIFYNVVCLQCWSSQLPTNTWVYTTTVFDYQYYFVVLLSTVLALLPRFIGHCLQSMLWPSDIVRAVGDSKQATQRGDNFLVSWSRSTSSSSIFRSHEMPSRSTPVVANPLTSVG